MNIQNTQAQQFIAAVKENARQVWDGKDDEQFVERILSVRELPDGSTQIADNYETLFGSIYRVDMQGNWFIRNAYSEAGERPYSFDKAMADASIMFTG